jgi:hypothetical protein
MRHNIRGFYFDRNDVRINKAGFVSVYKDACLEQKDRVVLHISSCDFSDQDITNVIDGIVAGYNFKQEEESESTKLDLTRIETLLYKLIDVVTSIQEAVR